MNAPGEPSDRESPNQSTGARVRSRLCVHCGKVVAPERKQLCDHCGEPFDDSDDPTDGGLAPKVVALTITSRLGLVGGVVIAFAIPVGLWVLAQLVQHGLAPYDQLHGALSPLVDLSLVEVALGPIGLAVAGWSAGVRSGLAWLALIVVGVPVLAFLWVVSVVTLSGALGEPF